MTNVLFHGSSTLVEGALNPMPSRVVDGERVVFATNKRWIALLNIVRFTGADLEYGYDEDGAAYIKEMYHDAFVKIALQGTGYLYTVSAEGFGGDERLGMPGSEFISRSAAPIIATEEIELVHLAILEDDECVMFHEYESDSDDSD